MRWRLTIGWPVRCWILGHDPRLTHKRDARGLPVLPSRVVWICNRCARELGQVLRVDARRQVQ